MSTYTQLDQSIVDAIRAGKHPLYTKAACAEARSLAEAAGREEMRVIDGRLQALRKAGKIVANRKADAGWVVIRDDGSKRDGHQEDEGPRYSDALDADEERGIISS